MADQCESISEWIAAMKEGDPSAQLQLWQRYYYQLVHSARKMLQERNPRRAFDEEDVLQSVFLNLFQRAEANEFPDLVDRDGLWRLLIVMTERRVLTKLRDANAKKRGGGIPRVALQGQDSSSQYFIDALDRPQPLPETAEQLVNIVEQVLGSCGELETEIAIRRMEGYEVNEIAKLVDRSPATVHRKLSYLKKKLRDEIECE